MQSGGYATYAAMISYLDEYIREEHNVAADHSDLISQLDSIMLEEHTPSKLARFHLKALGD